MLCDAGIVKRVSYTAANGLPLGSEVNDKFRKYIYLDSGLLLSILNMDFGGSQVLTELILAGAAEDLVNKGGLAEMMLGWELVKYSNPRAQHDLYYWENIVNGTSSEIDYVIVRNMKVMPIECKAGMSGKMKSLRLFMRNKHLNEAYRCSLENFALLEIKMFKMTMRLGESPLTHCMLSRICANERKYPQHVQQAYIPPHFTGNDKGLYATMKGGV